MKIGWGVSNQVVLHYSGKQIWFSYSTGAVFFAMPSAAVNLYLEPDVGALYFTRGGGVSFFGSTTFDNISAGGAGAHAFVNIGYQAEDRISYELDVFGSVPFEVDFTVFGPSLSVGYSWF